MAEQNSRCAFVPSSTVRPVSNHRIHPTPSSSSFSAATTTTTTTNNINCTDNSSNSNKNCTVNPNGTVAGSNLTVNHNGSTAGFGSRVTPISCSLAHVLLSPPLSATKSATLSHTFPTLQTQLLPAHAPRTAYPGKSFGGPVGTIVVLFRGDLRLHDHPPLTHALEEAATVVPVYCFDPRHFGKTAYGFEKTGRYRASFLIESVKALRESLKAVGSDIVLRIGRPEDVVPDMCRKLGAKRVFIHAETTYEEQLVEDELSNALSKHNAELKRFWGNTLYHIDDLPFDMDAVPDVYSDFREAVEFRSKVRPPLKTPDAMPPLPPSCGDLGDVPTLAQLNIDGDAPMHHLVSSGAHLSASPSTSVRSIAGGEAEALRRVRMYVDETRLEEYAAGHVGPHLGADFSCRISPWLALGCVSPRRIFEELRNAGVKPEMLTRSATYFELVWRDFFRFITCKYSAARVGKSRDASTAWTPYATTAASASL